MILDIPSILTQCGIAYIHKGSNYVFSCINPRHEDRNPSMSMNDEGLYQCWSCGEKGNIHTFVSTMTGKSLKEFLHIEDDLSFSFHANLHRQQKREFDKPKPRKLDFVGKTFDPWSNEHVVAYMNKIGMTKKFTSFFDVRYTLHSQIRFYDNVDYTHFVNRLCIPVRSSGKVINIIGRDFTEKQTPKELYPRGSTTDTFFNFDNIDRSKPIIVVEGMKGLIQIWQYFNQNVVSSFGSTLGRHQKEVIANIESLLLFVDNDEAGFAMVDAVEEIREKEYWITWMRTKGYDPADGTLNELKYALSHPIQSVDYYMRKSGLVSKPLAW